EKGIGWLERGNIPPSSVTEFSKGMLDSARDETLVLLGSSLAPRLWQVNCSFMVDKATLSINFCILFA
ncbi:hypothetical protein HAX54_025817, partial [Datura stramonium]|nr:hypothetical protein [Datura stramonium]